MSNHDPRSLADTDRYDSSRSPFTDCVPLDAGGDTWDAIVPFVESFIDFWEKGAGEPAIADHLPQSPPLLRKLTWSELVKIDLEYRYQKDRSKRRLEEYLAEIPDVTDTAGPPADVIFEEFHLRRETGESVSPQDYLERYPGRRDELDRLLNMDAPQATTSLCRPSQVEVEAGEKLGDFELMLPLGKGAFGSVFLARQISMQRLVAVKISSDHGSEPQTLAQLDHRYIVRVFDQHDVPERKLRLMYLQYVPGGTLDSVLKRVKGSAAEDRNGRLVVSVLEEQFEQSGGIVQLDELTRKRLGALSWAELVCQWGAQLAEALDYAHSHHVLHRDVKPANVLLAADGTPKLADFNVSFSSELDGVTAGAFFGGSLAYMSPEQLEAFDPRHARQPGELDGRADLYSLAVLLWELLTGERPFLSEAMYDSWPETLDALRAGRAQGIEPALLAADDELELRLKRILARCMQPACEQRFETGQELAQALRLCLQPRAARLLERPESGWRRWCQRYSMLAAVVAVLIPNILAGLFNYGYNQLEIIQHVFGAAEVFDHVQMGINLVAFPLGIGVVALYMRPIARQLRSLFDGGQPAAAILDGGPAQSRLRSLRLGRFIAWVVIGLWSVAGLAYPLVLELNMVQMTGMNYVHFFASLVYCGLFAAVFPYLLISVLTLRAYYPGLLEGYSLDEDEFSELESLGRRSGLFLLLAGAMPAFGILAIIIVSLFRTSGSVMPQIALSIAGVAGFVMAFALFRVIQQDLDALTTALRNSDDH